LRADSGTIGCRQHDPPYDIIREKSAVFIQVPVDAVTTMPTVVKGGSRVMDKAENAARYIDHMVKQGRQIMQARQPERTQSQQNEQSTPQAMVIVAAPRGPGR
jgi:hypothetical protein